MTLRELLTDNRAAIMRCFVEGVVGKDLAPAGTAKSQLIDALPRFLDEIVAKLDSVSSGTARSKTRPARVRPPANTAVNAGAWLRFGSGRSRVRVLRSAIIATAKKESCPLTLDELESLSQV